MKCCECPEYKTCRRKADLRRVRHRCSLAKAPPKPQTNADRMIAMIQNGQVCELLDWWQEIFEDGVPGDDYFAWWLRLPAKEVSVE